MQDRSSDRRPRRETVRAHAVAVLAAFAGVFGLAAPVAAQPSILTPCLTEDERDS